MKKSSSGRWLKEHFSDVYVKRAKQEGFRARSVYKLM
ncbi:MAG TPA: 23S rRNA methyltransferase, partial [Coxiellaceae bacterium]|nr:23S rRNA methyltransferase [Coxiellaceae bacterium]